MDEVTSERDRLRDDLNRKEDELDRVRVMAMQQSSAGTRLIKLRETVDQASEQTCDYLSDGELASCYTRYEAVYGKDTKPPKEEELTKEQLASVDYLLKEGHNPYVDFPVWGPRGYAIQRKIKLAGQVFDNKGALHTVELLGPGNFETWLSCFNMWQHAMVMLDAVDLGRMTEYRRIMEQFHQKAGEEAWILQYQCDFRTRKVHMERVKLEGYRSYQAAKDANWGRDPYSHPYDPTRPWDYVLDTINKDRD